MADYLELVKSNDIQRTKEFLNENPEKVNESDETGRTAFGWACSNTDTGMMALLIERGADVNTPDKNGIVPVHILASRGSTEGMAILLKEKVNVNAVTDMGFTALHYVNAPGNIENRIKIIGQLFDNGADHTIKNKNGDTPLNFAFAFFTDIRIVKALLDRGASYNLSGNRAFNILQKAAEFGLSDLFKEVFKKAQPVLLSDEQVKDNLVRCVVTGGETELLKYLRDKNVVLNREKNVYGCTLIHYAALSGNKKMLEYLYDNGFDIDERNNSGESAFNIAQKKNDNEMMQLIIDLGGNDHDREWPALRGEYLGQKTPGMIPELFAPGIVSTEVYEGCSGWGSEMKYFLFQRWVDGIPKLYIMNRIEGVWNEPEEIPFGTTHDVGDFTIAPDGRTILFAAKRDEDGNHCEWAYIWKSTKTENGWTEPELFDAPVHSQYQESYPCMAAGGNLYFFSWRPGGHGKSDIYLSEFKNDGYLPPVNLGNPPNSENYDWDAYIAPDESYIIFSSMVPGGAYDNLHISFRQKDDNWSTPVFMEEINSQYSDNRPYVTPDGKYLFFYSGRSGNGDIYWVDARIIDRYRERTRE